MSEEDVDLTCRLLVEENSQYSNKKSFNETYTQLVKSLYHDSDSLLLVAQQSVHPPTVNVMILNEHTAESNLLLWSESVMAAGGGVLYHARGCLLT